MALRLLALKQIYKILGMECLIQPSTSSINVNNKTPQKRPLEQSENELEGSGNVLDFLFHS